MSTFGKRLRIARKNKKLTQRKLAELINVTYSSISEWENNHHQPDIDTLGELCQALDVEASWLLSSNAPGPNSELASYLKGELEELSEEAKKEIDNFIAYIKTKYKKK